VGFFWALSLLDLSDGGGVRLYCALDNEAGVLGFLGVYITPVTAAFLFCLSASSLYFLYIFAGAKCVYDIQWFDIEQGYVYTSHVYICIAAINMYLRNRLLRHKSTIDINHNEDRLPPDSDRITLHYMIAAARAHRQLHNSSDSALRLMTGRCRASRGSGFSALAADSFMNRGALRSSRAIE
jgi:hypothetical protein